MAEFRVREWNLEELKGRKIWIPHMCDSAYILSAILRSLGYDSGVLARSKDPGFSLGRAHTDGDQCLPSIITTDEILQRVNSQDFDENREAFFQGKSEGPCRYGRYYMNQQAIFYDLGINVPIFTLDNRNAYGGLGSAAKIFAWDGMVAQALLERAVHFTRPFEVSPGDSERVYDDYLKSLCREVEKGISGSKLRCGFLVVANSHKHSLERIVDSAIKEFAKIERKPVDKPVIFVTGEIYVRTNEIANQDIVRRIEELGGVALVEPAISFFEYINELKFREADRQGLRALLRRNKFALEIKFMRRDAHDFEKRFAGLLNEFSYDPSGKEIIDFGRIYLHERHKGEAIVSLGTSHYYSKLVDGIINVLPFSCLPGTIVRSKTDEFRKRNGGIPFLNLAYDGHPDPNRDEQLGVFMYQVRKRSHLE